MLELAHLRNQLCNNQFTDFELQLIDKIRKEVDLYDFKFSKLILSCIDNALIDAKRDNFKSAINEIQFIHNLPINDKEYLSWDEKHFYSVELLSYIEIVDDIARIKDVIVLLSESLKD